MARELHHRKKDNKYALWSSVVDGYITEWDTKENIRQFWINEKIKNIAEQIDEWMEDIDKEV